MISFLLMFTVCYLIGSVNTATLVSRFSHLSDPRSGGSKNPGATNMWRLHGKKIGLMVFLGDFLKGCLPAYFYLQQSGMTVEVFLLMLALILGHCFSCWLNFQGGKGFATFLGILFATNSVLTLQASFVWIFIYILTRISALSALSVCMFVMGFCLNHSQYIPLSLSALLVLWRHKPNWEQWAQQASSATRP